MLAIITFLQFVLHLTMSFFSFHGHIGRMICINFAVSKYNTIQSLSYDLFSFALSIQIFDMFMEVGMKDLLSMARF